MKLLSRSKGRHMRSLLTAGPELAPGLWLLSVESTNASDPKGQGSPEQCLAIEEKPFSFRLVGGENEVRRCFYSVVWRFFCSTPGPVEHQLSS